MAEAGKRVRRTVGGYASSHRSASELRPPPSGPGVGAMSERRAEWRRIKREASAEKLARRRARRAQRRREIRCFWTRPMCHVWQRMSFDYQCKCCGKVSYDD